MGLMWKSRHAGFFVMVRDAVPRRHPVTGDIIEGGRPRLDCEFGFPTGEQRVHNPLTGQIDVLEGYQGGFFDLDSAAEQLGWNEDEKGLVERELDRQCQLRPGSVQRVDFVIAPAERPWPTYDDETDPQKLYEQAVPLGLAGKTLAYERENRQRPDLVKALQEHLAASPEPEPEAPPVLAIETKPGEPELQRVAVV